jgi:hypothetical protein
MRCDFVERKIGSELNKFICSLIAEIINQPIINKNTG